MKICPNCAERLTSLKEKCPKCGIIPERTKSPILMGIVVAAALLVIVVMGLFFSKP